MPVEREVQRTREGSRRELIERLNSEERPLSREEVEEHERRAEREDRSRSLKGVLLCLAACSSWPVVFGLVAGAEAYVWLPGPVGLWIGILPVYAAFRYWRWGRPAARAVWVASFIEWLAILLAPRFSVGTPVLGLGRISYAGPHSLRGGWMVSGRSLGRRWANNSQPALV